MQEVVSVTRWVPAASSDWRVALFGLIEGLAGRRVCVLTGAGCSTESGIPDYRGEGTQRRARNPIQFRQFVESDLGRKRYWARSMLGWPKFTRAAPSMAHCSLARGEESGFITGIITQNVDRLHQRAGSKRVVELHGALEEVTCLTCSQLLSRSSVQEKLVEMNSEWLLSGVELAPDGDADLESMSFETFHVPVCPVCGGDLKPNVVFFGEGVRRTVVDEAFAFLARAEALLVVGSSLAVFSGYRFAREAHRQGKPIFVVNIGKTRADPLAQVIVQGRAGEVLSLWVEQQTPSLQVKGQAKID